ncbi:MAG: hypothetical protein P8018_07915 [Acidobacteriota bacterium]|jgi:DNA-binding beta-propeller fold protein YncE
MKGTFNLKITAVVFAASLFASALPAASAKTPSPVVLKLPGGSQGIGFDDLQYSSILKMVLAPAAQTGDLDLIAPGSLKISTISGFSREKSFKGGHGEGITSVSENGRFLFVTDRTTRLLNVVNESTRKVVASVNLGGGPDYVRWVAPTHEIWVTEPGRSGIEIFKLPSGANPVPVHSGFIHVEGGPEALCIDATRNRAYTNLWSNKTLAINLKTRKVVARWPNGNAGSRGLALDSARGFLFVGGKNGRAVVLDVNHGGKILSSLKSGLGVDIIDYDPALRHLYLPGARSATMAVIGVSSKGSLTLLKVLPTVKGAHSVVAAPDGKVFVCDPRQGALLVYKDTLPKA